MKTNYTDNEYPQVEIFDEIPLERCKQTRFGGISYDNNTLWWCADKEFFNLTGGLSGNNRRFIFINLAYCNQLVLSKMFPG